MMEWLGGTISQEDVGEDGTSVRNSSKRRCDDDGEDDAPGALALRFQHLELFSNPQALLQTYSSKDPKLILAVPVSLSHSPSRHLFSDFAAVQDNFVLLTGRGEEGTLGRALFDRWNDGQRADDKWDKGRIGSNVMMDGLLKIRLNSKAPLPGAEFEAHLQKERQGYTYLPLSLQHIRSVSQEHVKTFENLEFLSLSLFACRLSGSTAPALCPDHFRLLLRIS